MAEVIGLAGSLIGIAGVGTQLALTLYRFSDALGSACCEAQNVASEITLFSTTLIEVSKIVDKRDTDNKGLQDVVIDTVKACESLLCDIKSLVSDIASTKTSTRSVWISRIKWILHKPKVLSMRSSIESCKSTLLLLVASCNVIEARHREAPPSVIAPLQLAVQGLLKASDLATNKMIAADAHVSSGAASEPDDLIDIGLVTDVPWSDRSVETPPPDETKLPDNHVEGLHEKPVSQSMSLVLLAKAAVTKMATDTIEHRQYQAQWSWTSTPVTHLPPRTPSPPRVDFAATPPPPQTSDGSYVRVEGDTSQKASEKMFRLYGDNVVEVIEEGSVGSSETEELAADTQPALQGDIDRNDAKFYSQGTADRISVLERLLSKQKSSRARSIHEQADIDRLERLEELIRDQDRAKQRAGTREQQQDSLALTETLAKVQKMLETAESGAHGGRAADASKPPTVFAPIKFKDAVNRKFTFPYDIAKTWKGMESLIKQAFMHVDLLGPHVMEGHYDLIGPDGEIILPQVYDMMIKPDYNIEMQMWPIPELEKKKKNTVYRSDSAQPTHGSIDLDGLMKGVKIGARKGTPPHPEMPPPPGRGNLVSATGIDHDALTAGTSTDFGIRKAKGKESTMSKWLKGLVPGEHHLTHSVRG